MPFHEYLFPTWPGPLPGTLWRRGEKGERLFPLFPTSPLYPKEPPSPGRACSKASLFGR